MADGPWRVGRKIPKNLYVDDEDVGRMDDPFMANSVVEGMNRFEKAEEELEEVRAALVKAQAERDVAYAAVDQARAESFEAAARESESCRTGPGTLIAEDIRALAKGLPTPLFTKEDVDAERRKAMRHGWYAGRSGLRDSVMETIDRWGGIEAHRVERVFDREVDLDEVIEKEMREYEWFEGRTAGITRKT